MSSFELSVIFHITAHEATIYSICFRGNKSLTLALQHGRFFTLPSCFATVSISLDTLTATQSLTVNQTHVSSKEVFELGFFNSSSSRWYLGIRSKTIPDETVVWVANRDTPLGNSIGIPKIGDRENLVLLDEAENPIWSSNQTAAINPDLQLLDSGTLLLREANENDTSKFLWQCFDYPTDTILPGMMLGWNLDTLLERRITSWRSENYPSSGDFSYRLHFRGSPEVFTWNKLSMAWCTI